MRSVSSKQTDTTENHQINLVEMSGRYQEPLIISVYGNEGGGKSRLIGTAKGDIGVIPLERKTRQPVLRAAEECGKRVFMPDIDLIRSSRADLLETMPAECITPDDVRKGRTMRDEDADKQAQRKMEERVAEIELDGPTPTCCQRCYYRWHANRVKSVAYRMAAMENIGTIAIDTFGQFVDDMLFANYGRNERIMPLDRKSFNREVIDFINAINHKNLILTHHMDVIWADNKPTKRTKPKNSFSKIGHFTSVVVKLMRDKEANVDKGEAVYQLFVEDCQANVGIIDSQTPLLTDEMVTFQNLAVQVYPDSDYEEWV